MTRPAVGAMLAALLITACDTSPAVAPHDRDPRPPVIAGAPHEAAPPAAEAAETARGRDLREDERRGGHTIARHVGKSDDELRARLQRERGISAASTYTDMEIAERVVAATLERGSRQLQRWTARDGRRPNLALDYDGDPAEVIGRSLRRGRRQAEPCHDAVVVLRWDDRRGDYYVLTSYPEIRR